MRSDQVLTGLATAALSFGGTVIAAWIARSKPQDAQPGPAQWIITITRWPVIAALFALNAIVGAITYVSTYVHENQSVDATAQIRLDNVKGLLPEQGHATVEITVKPWRKKALITLQTSDHRPELGTCRISTELQVTPLIAKNPGPTIRTLPGEEFQVDIRPGAEKLSLEVVVINKAKDANCAVDLSVLKVTLSND
ncbi:hypothetical protein ACBR40_02345 [Nonomuraea sp. AD125B]|uniref:hypothetical protein n=1 Tax=Nonomuraea TaxID=83681 RepID=UPI0031E46677